MATYSHRDIGLGVLQDHSCQYSVGVNRALHWDPESHLYTQNDLSGDVDSGLGEAQFPHPQSEGLEAEVLWTQLSEFHPQSGPFPISSPGDFTHPPQASRSCSGLLGNTMIIPVFVCDCLLDQPRGLSTLPVPLQTSVFTYGMGHQGHQGQC